MLAFCQTFITLTQKEIKRRKWDRGSSNIQGQITLSPIKLCQKGLKYDSGISSNLTMSKMFVKLSKSRRTGPKVNLKT